MFNKFKEIVSAWIIANNPTDDQKILAENRFTVCDSCPSKKVLSDKFKISTTCAECGCPIAKKVFSPVFNACPLKKWEDVDNKFFTQTQKNTKTFL